MSSYIKTVVQEVLHAKQPTNTFSEAYRFDTATTSKQIERVSQYSELDRPNYQRSNMQKRLAILDMNEKDAAKLSSVVSFPPYEMKNSDNKNDNVRQHAFRSVIDVSGEQHNDSPLRTVMMQAMLHKSSIQEKQAAALVQSNNSLYKNSLVKEEAQTLPITTEQLNEQSRTPTLLAKLENGLYFWLYPHLSSKLYSYMNGYSGTVKHIAVVEAAEYDPLYVAILQNYADDKDITATVKASLSHGFQFILESNHEQKLRKALLKLEEDGLAYHSQQQFIFINKPNVQVAKQFQLGRQDAIFIMRLVSRFQAISILDQAIKKGMSPHLKFVIEPTYTLLIGLEEEVEKGRRFIMDLL